jgi:lysine decarboxylase
MVERETLALENTPLYDAVLRHAGANYTAFHMPGHAGKKVLGAALNPLSALDLTELPGLDDWHAPAGCIAGAESLLAAAFQAAAARMLVDGSSGGIKALFLGAFREGDPVILPRHAHRSFFSGLVLSGAVPVYLPPVFFRDWPVPVTTAEAVLAALEEHPEAKGIFLVDPSVDGTSADLSAVAAASRRRDLRFFVDQAQGAHFAFHEAYPPSALVQGAEAMVCGLHKTWPVLTPGAALLFSSANAPGAPWVSAVQRSLSLNTTTSPAYPLLASIDRGRALMAQSGRKYLECAAQLSRHYQGEMAKIPGLRVLQTEYPGAYDYLKVVLRPEGWSLSGGQTAEFLRRQSHIQVEMAREDSLMAMLSLFHTEADWQLLLAALQKLSAAYGLPGQKTRPFTPPPLPELALSPRQAHFAPRRTVKLADSAGQISATLLAPYPPGVPVLAPGEIISPELVDYLQALAATGQHFHGIKEDKLEFIDIIEI